MQTYALARNLKISARKLRLSAAVVRGKRVVDAQNTLAAMPQKGAVMVAEALKSAIANAENNHNARKSNLHIQAITVDEGRTLKRFRPRSRGMAHPILHRSSHLKVVVSDDVTESKPAPETTKAAAKTTTKKKEGAK